MKKIPTLFERIYENHKIVGITKKITPGCEEAFFHGRATVKVDGACCAIINGEFYKRYDAKKGRKPPAGAIPCCDPDPITGHWPHWVRVDANKSEDKWFLEAFHYSSKPYEDGTYEAVGLHFNGNPYNIEYDFLYPHGSVTIHNLDRNFESVDDWLSHHKDEGIVFWLNDEPVCKIKRSDFGLPWPVK